MKYIIIIEDVKPTPEYQKNLRVTFNEFGESGDQITHAKLLLEHLDNAVEKYFEHFEDKGETPEAAPCLH